MVLMAMVFAKLSNFEKYVDIIKLYNYIYIYIYIFLSDGFCAVIVPKDLHLSCTMI